MPVAQIAENTCIGCTKCLKVCPVDAILGGPKQMHTVLSEYCTACGDCLPACPVDCITLVAAHSPAGKDSAIRQKRRQQRLENESSCKSKQDAQFSSDIPAAIQGCLDRFRAKKQNQSFLWEKHE